MRRILMGMFLLATSPERRTPASILRPSAIPNAATYSCSLCHINPGGVVTGTRSIDPLETNGHIQGNKVE